MKLNYLQKSILIFSLIFIVFFFFKNYRNKEFFINIVKDFTRKNNRKLDDFIHPQYGVFTNYFDGVYEIFSLDNKINSYSQLSLYTNFEFGEATYIGNGKFVKEGSFFSNFSGQYLPDSNFNLKVPLNKIDLEKAQKLELITKYKIVAISRNHLETYQFNFGIENHKIYLCAVIFSKVPDIDMVNINAKTISFDNTTDIETFLKNKRFCNKDGIDYVDFNTNTLTDKQGKNVLYFSKIAIGDIASSNPGNVQTRLVQFDNKFGEEVDEVTLTNNGELIRWGSGCCNPQIKYTLCKNVNSAVSAKPTDVIPNIDSIIRNHNKSLFIESIINTNGNLLYEVTQDTSRHMYLIIDKKTKEEFSYSASVKSIDSYTFYTNKGVNEIKTYYNSKGAIVDDTNIIRLNTGGTSQCIVIQLGQDGNMTKIKASWECD